jgi:hypothetical protein
MLRHWQAASSPQTRMGRRRLWSTLTLTRSNSFSWHELKVKIMASWRIDLVCSKAEVSYKHAKWFYVFFLLFYGLDRNSLLPIVHSGVRIECCYWFLVDVIMRTILLFTVYQGKAMMQNHSVCPFEQFFFYAV